MFGPLKPGTYAATYTPDVVGSIGVPDELKITKEDPQRRECFVVFLHRDEPLPDGGAQPFRQLPVTLPAGWTVFRMVREFPVGDQASPHPCSDGSLAAGGPQQLEGKISWQGAAPTAIDSIDVLMTWGDTDAEKEYLHAENVPVQR
jgi:hypothetical protein